MFIKKSIPNFTFSHFSVFSP